MLDTEVLDLFLAAKNRLPAKKCWVSPVRMHLGQPEEGLEPCYQPCQCCGTWNFPCTSSLPGLNKWGVGGAQSPNTMLALGVSTEGPAGITPLRRLKLLPEPSTKGPASVQLLKLLPRRPSKYYAF